MSRLNPPLLLVTTLLLALGAGCTDCETSGQDAIPFADGLNPDASSYETTPVDGEYLHFPPGRRFDLVHRLGVAPITVQTYLSFDVRPLAAGADGGNIAESAGNLVVIERQNAELVRVRNDTCSEMYLRVVAFATDVALADDGVSANVPQPE